MAKFPSLFRAGKNETKEVMRALANLESKKTPVRIEIESENIRFFSVVSLKRGLVVIAKPPGLRKGIKREGFVRFSIPEVQKDLRFEVTVPHFNLLSGGYVFLCKIPQNFAAPSQRTTERYNTSRFKNLHLYFPVLRTRFRVIDISVSGCKVFSQGTNAGSIFQLGTAVEPVKITVGQKVEIDLAGVVPRAFSGSTVGFQLQIGSDGRAAKYLQHFISSLESAEITSLKVETG